MLTVPSPTRRSARIAEKRRSVLQEIRPDDDPWLSTIDPDFFSTTTETAGSVPITKKQRASLSEFEMSEDEMEQMIWTLVWSQDQIYPEYINSFDKDYIKKLHTEYSVSALKHKWAFIVTCFTSLFVYMYCKHIYLYYHIFNLSATLLAWRALSDIIVKMI